MGSRWWLRLILIGFIGCLALAWLLRRPLLAQVGQVLVFERSGFDKVDAVLVLPGSVPDRVLGAVDLFNESRASLVLLGRDRASGDQLFLESLGVHRMQDFEVNREVLVRLGVAPDKVRLLPVDSGSTSQDALALSRFLKDSEVHSVAIVTCKYHSYRAYLNFRDRLRGSGVSIYSVPSPHCRFDPQNWWKNRDQVKTVYMELGKLVAYRLGFS